MPAAVTPQVSATPPVTAATLTPGGACTSTGLDWLVLVPSPSWPRPVPPPTRPVPLPPQHQAAALRPAASPPLCPSPPLTAAKLTPAGACTSTGLDRFVIVPSPSWPLPLAPQQ